MIIIPAKYKSSRTPQKNFRPFFQGLSLLQIAAIRSVTANCGPVAISSDNYDATLKQVANLPSEIGRLIDVHKRPDRLSHDPATILDVLVDYISNTRFDAPASVATVLPTSPFNSSAAVKHAWETFHRSDAQYLLSVSPASKPPFNAWVDAGEANAGQLQYAFPDSPYRSTQSTACPPAYFSNGCVSVYAADVLTGDRCFNWTLGYKMPETSGIDIDFEYEFDIAQALFPSWCEDLEQLSF